MENAPRSVNVNDMCNKPVVLLTYYFFGNYFFSDSLVSLKSVHRLVLKFILFDVPQNDDQFIVVINFPVRFFLHSA